MKTDGIIFDLEGTLWDSTRPVYDSWKEYLTQHTLIRMNGEFHQDTPKTSGRVKRHRNKENRPYGRLKFVA